MRLLIVQFSGDYREAVQSFARGEDEVYYAQRYSIESVAKLQDYADEVTVLCAKTTEAYDEELPNGVRAIGGGFGPDISYPKLMSIIAAQRPTHVIVRPANLELLSWVIRHNVRAIALFAESVVSRGIRSRWRNYRLAQALNHPQIEWVGSYGINSSLNLQQLGVNPDKIVPWDFILETTPGSFAPKPLRQGPWTLFYIGAMREDKGVGDILTAVATLRSKGLPVQLQLVGRDDKGLFKDRVQQLGLQNSVKFLGIVSNHDVEPLMHAADIVLIPSRHEYPEGFPLTIHHALRSRTPIVASDHPMFRNNLESGVSALIFPAGQPEAIAQRIDQLLSDPTLYYRLSDASADTWSRLRLPVKWADVMEHWLDDSPQSQQWLYSHRISSGLYQRQAGADMVSPAVSWIRFPQAPKV